MHRKNYVDSAKEVLGDMMNVVSNRSWELKRVHCFDGRLSFINVYSECTPVIKKFAFLEVKMTAQEPNEDVGSMVHVLFCLKQCESNIFKS